MIDDFKKFKAKDEDLNLVQENVAKVFKSILANPLIDMVFLKDIDLLTGQDNIVEHKLQRKPLGFVIVNKNAEADIWQESVVLASKTMNLKSSADVKISLIIF